MTSYDWPIEFKQVYDAATARYQHGERTPAKLFTPAHLIFLKTIGCTPQELFDFIDDKCRYGEPAYETTLLVTAVRHHYFKIVQRGAPSSKLISMEDLPPKNAAVDGIEWLPRLIEKARAKLRGEMPDELMYGCGGDRPFLRSMNVELAEFLQVVWSAGEDNRKIIDYVKARRDRAVS